jgi:hypothetical protein
MEDEMKANRALRLRGYGLFLFLILAFATSPAVAAQSPPLATQIKTGVGSVASGKIIRVPLITWGGDIATILANGSAAKTGSNSIFAQKGLSLDLFRQDDFKKQVEAYMRGETPFLRGTMGMINMAADLLNKDPRTKPVLIY